MSQKIVAIGDIHGCVRSLKTLWNQLKPHKDAIHVFIGDYIDRGPDSKGVVDFLLDVQYDRKCVFLRGNHEQMLLNALNKDEMDLWMYNGGEVTLKSYNHARHISDIPAEHIEFYRNTKLYFETDDYFFVHAGVPPHQTLEKSKEDAKAMRYFLWGREHLNAFEVPWEKLVIFGHTPRPYPIQKNGMIGIDTGCVYSELGYGKLTALVLPEKEFIQQKSLD
ncbi:metallophosphoesterase family protein [Rhodohalobacter sp. 614A]|uniref:metallophosphoesterase family protein n=1 Tax=Rhodohalobacter sp. 614A TaxID=2908649 RepID=UPI001F415372|nr:metallophosphoesterase family protein [Rhodohalobacter sp. 614A]